MVDRGEVIFVCLNIVLLVTVVSALPTNYTENGENAEPNIVSGKNISVVLETDDFDDGKTSEKTTVVFVPTGNGPEVVDRVSESLSFNDTIIQNGSLTNNGNNTTVLDEEPPLNLAILPVLGGFIIITVLCIKCCNRVKADVNKERECIEDGKPLFRVEPESHPDYLSSIGSGYTPYSTVTSGYNPYNTVTTLMSNISTVSETKDMATMVKPRDIWKTMRQTRGTSVPDPDDLARERILLENVVEEVRKLADSSTSHNLSSIRKHLSDSHNSIPTFDRSLKPHLPPKRLHKSEEVLSSGSSRKSSQMVTEVEHHIPTAKNVASADKSLGTKEEKEGLLSGTSDNIDSSSLNESSSEGLTPQTTETSAESDCPNTTRRSNSSESSSDSSSPDVKKNSSPLRSNLKNSDRPRTRTVSFKESGTRKKKSPGKERQQAADNKRSESPNNVQITRSPLASSKNTVRRFSLSKVTDNGIQCVMGLPVRPEKGSSPKA